VQDLLDLGLEGRFNVPGTQKGNWKWRIEDLKNLITPLEKLKNLNVSCGRIST
jgi:4-alpha-glucanotransferase